MPWHGYSDEIPNCTPPQTARESGIMMCERTDADQSTHWSKLGDTTKARKRGQTASPGSSAGGLWKCNGHGGPEFRQYISPGSNHGKARSESTCLVRQVARIRRQGAE